MAQVASQVVDTGIAITEKIANAFNKDDGKYKMQHNFKAGIVSPGDICLNKVSVRVGHDFPASLHAKKRYNVKNMVNGNPITAIHILDMWTDDTGGNSEIVGGGLGHTFVDIELTSKLMRGFEFEILIFGKP